MAKLQGKHKSVNRPWLTKHPFRTNTLSGAVGGGEKDITNNLTKPPMNFVLHHHRCNKLSTGTTYKNAARGWTSQIQALYINRNGISMC